MKQQINEIKRMQQLAGLINESQLNEAPRYDLGPAIDLKKLSKLLDKALDKNGDRIMDNNDKSILLSTLKNLPKFLKQLDDEDEMDDAAYELETTPDLNSLFNVDEKTEKVFRPIQNAILSIQQAGEDVNPKWAIKGYKEIAAYLNKIK